MIPFLFTIAAASIDPRCAERVEPYQPRLGVIASSEMAAAVAETYLRGIFPADIVARDIPLEVRLNRGVWHIRGKALPKGVLGGVAEIDLCRSNGLVLHVIHGQ